MMTHLVDIMGVEPGWQTRHRVKALARDGKSRVVADLAKLNRLHPEDHKKILKAIRLVAENDRVHNKNYVKQGDIHKEVYEMRAPQGHARLFFFYTPDKEEIVVCSNYYWKAKSSPAEQNAAFERCDKFRIEYLKSHQTGS